MRMQRLRGHPGRPPPAALATGPIALVQHRGRGSSKHPDYRSPAGADVDLADHAVAAAERQQPSGARRPRRLATDPDLVPFLSRSNPRGRRALLPRVAERHSGVRTPRQPPFVASSQCERSDPRRPPAAAACLRVRAGARGRPRASPLVANCGPSLWMGGNLLRARRGHRLEHT